MKKYKIDNNDMNDVIEISRGTTKEDELFDYVKASDYLKSNKNYYDKKKKMIFSYNHLILL